MRKVLILMSVFAILLAAWEGFTQSIESLQFMLPAPSKVLHVLLNSSDRLAFHALATTKEMIGGFALAFVFSFPLAWVMFQFGSLRLILQPLFVAMQCLPMFALAPIMILWFGWSYWAIIVPTALMIFFPLTINIYQGLTATPTNLLQFFQLHQATRWQIFYRLQLPWALPHIFAGFRIGVAMAGIGAVAGEWAGAQHGLGILMLESRRSADLEMMFAALVCVMMLTLMSFAFVSWLENYFDRRHHRLKPTGGLSTACILLAILFTGCNTNEPRVEQTTLVLDWLPNPNHVPIYAGIGRGFFAEEGIQLNVIKVADPGDSVPYLLSKQASLCLTYMPHTMQVLSKHDLVKPIGILIKEPLNALIYRVHDAITEPKDLSGRVLGYSVDGFQTKFLDILLENQKIKPKAMHNASFDLVGMLATKHVDVVYGAYWNIEGENLLAHGIETNYFPLSAFGVPTYYELIFLAHKHTLQVSPDFVKSFQRAMQKSIDYSKVHSKEAFDIYLKANPDKSMLTRDWEWKAWQKTIPTLATQQDIDMNVWNTFRQWLITNNLIN